MSHNSVGRQPDSPVHAHWPGEFEFCPMCGAELGERVVAGKSRRSCAACGFVHFRNPGVGAAVVLRDEAGRLLLVRRAPGATKPGMWSIPAGFVDYGEEIRAAAARELSEETGLEATIGDPVWVATNFHDEAKVTVGIWFAGTMTGGVLTAGDDADEVGWFSLEALPPLAFETDMAYIATLG